MRTRAHAQTKYAPSWRWKTHANIARRRAEDGGALVLLQRIVPGQRVREGLAKMFRELLGDVHRAVLAAGAADRDGEIAAVRLRELPDAPVQEVDQIREHALHAGMCGEILHHR